MDVESLAPAPGSANSGYVDVADLPTGVTERIPVVVAEGAADGPELWITAAIHGDEANGLAVAQDVVAALDPERLRGRVVAVPTLNPAGLRRNERTSYYGGEDPNRCFPDPDADDDEPPSQQERINEGIYEAFADAADAVLDLHTAAIDAYPFNIRHRVLYGERRTETEARALADELDRLLRAFGLPIANQREEYVGRDYHRTTTGAALNAAGIPAMTVELGGHSVVDDDVVNAGVAGCFRVMDAMGMLEGVPDEIAAADPGYEAPVEYPVKRIDGPHTEAGGIVRHRLAKGEAFEAGDPIADVRSPHGERKTTVTAERDGYVIDRSEGALVYPGDAVAGVVVRDDGDVVVPRDGEE